MPDPTADLPFAWGGPAGSGVLRASAEDFQVVEDLGIEPSGSGEHVLLKIRKRNLNTVEVATHIARLAGIRPRDVSYAGLKDRVAVTTQSFSVHLPGKEAPDWAELEGGNLQVLEAVRHHRKLRRGSLRGNVFTLRVRQFSGDAGALEARLQQIDEQGVPNYFGAQRFGRDGNNLQRAQALFAGEIKKLRRDKRSIWLSAARSWLFNKVLAVRVSEGTWNRLLPGDVMQLAGGRGQFPAEAEDDELASRLRNQKVHVTGPLYGKASRALQPGSAAAELEQAVLSAEQSWLDGLRRFGLEADRRSLRLSVDDLQWQLHKDELELCFGLVSGGYATAVARELFQSV
ncbi:tRNA pseudouridine(13) synthase TruD [Thiolapillus sp.]|uniref:tRNA pseudouridine(13) synthase TruD n=3 Tax=Thiolapillus sp. TaxID=2017437 RepID=UPI0025FA2D8D|nr:tRNA pseudouridine(13) synthase TruD [Thiolapillus sp.]